MFHDPIEKIKKIQELIISDKKKIGFLFGAGTSLSQKPGNYPCQVPAIGKMTAEILQKISQEDIRYQKALVEMVNELGPQYNIEKMLSCVEKKIEVIGSGKLNDLDKCDFETIRRKIKGAIFDLVSVHEGIGPEDYKLLIQTDFAEWIRKADRKHAVEIFTTNYDYLFEIGLEYWDVPYVDGFFGSYEPFFCSELIEEYSALPNVTKLWKIHGSLGWYLQETEDTSKVIKSKTCVGEDMLIYPSLLKYDNSKKQPYVSLIDRLCAFLKQDDAVLFICGYSFGDEHINERVISSICQSSTSHVFGFLFDETNKDGTRLYALDDPNSRIRRLASKYPRLSIYGMNSAVIGGQYGKWRLTREPDKNDYLDISRYFDENAPEPVDENGKHKGDEKWTGDGLLWLPDFSRFVDFLKLVIC